MNGIMPGPMWLATASAAYDTAIENRNPTHGLKNDTVTGKMTKNEEDVIDRGRNCHAGGEVKKRGKNERTRMCNMFFSRQV